MEKTDKEISREEGDPRELSVQGHESSFIHSVRAFKSSLHFERDIEMTETLFWGPH